MSEKESKKYTYARTWYVRYPSGSEIAGLEKKKFPSLSPENTFLDMR